MRKNIIGLYRGKPHVETDADRFYFETFSQHWKENCKNGFVYGNLIVLKDKYYICVSGFENLQSNKNNGIVSMIQVIPETVGEYAGFDDTNGKKIFEGDIVREYGGTFEQGFYETDRNLVVEIPTTIVNLVIGSDCGYKYEIVGNIHDNPELSKHITKEF